MAYSKYYAMRASLLSVATLLERPDMAGNVLGGIEQDVHSSIGHQQLLGIPTSYLTKTYSTHPQSYLLICH